MSFQREMFVYLICLLVLINAFGPEEVMAQGDCVDRMPAGECQKFKDKGNCESPYHEIVAERMCKKTCNRC
ncbi:hypothetical protein Y032_0590g389 [Ancylostoma ceylanicum]|uniref:ShKT domain-containing protein n=1 Tax=Ancylostoma ceylanicum TaxID=53326 RepID=A0A016WPF1_9BILA|nr:hypothetical protein Y032_0590g389 [Ancylostoma ceylanicum]